MSEPADSEWLVERDTSHDGLKVARVTTPSGYCMLAPIDENMTDDELRGLADHWMRCHLAALIRGNGRKPTGL